VDAADPPGHSRSDQNRRTCHARTPHPVFFPNTPNTSSIRSQSTTRPEAPPIDPTQECTSHLPFSSALYTSRASQIPGNFFSIPLARNEPSQKRARESRPPRRGIRFARLRESIHLSLPVFLPANSPRFCGPGTEPKLGSFPSIRFQISWKSATRRRRFAGATHSPRYRVGLI
jgi:hypothetical protein